MKNFRPSSEKLVKVDASCILFIIISKKIIMRKGNQFLDGTIKDQL